MQKAVAKDSGRVIRLFVQDQASRIVIEPNQVIRGTVFPTEQRELVPAAEETFEMAVSVPTLALADLYGGKICAALDRQHPRDLFDVKLLLEAGGIDEATPKTFVVYLASHNRPMSELLDPIRKDFRAAYENEFAGMVGAPANVRAMALLNRGLTRSNEGNFPLAKEDLQTVLNMAGAPSRVRRAARDKLNRLQKRSV